MAGQARRANALAKRKRSMAGALLLKGGGMKAPSGAGAPGLVVAASGLARAWSEGRAVGTDRGRRAGRVSHMSAFPTGGACNFPRSAARRPCDGAIRSSPAESSRLPTRHYRSPNGARSRAPDRCQAADNRCCRTRHGQPARQSGGCRTAC